MSGKILENITSMVIDPTNSMGTPTSIAFFSNPDTLYVGGEHSVSVIDVGNYPNNTKITEIPAFNPVDIKLLNANGINNKQNHRIYVANQGMMGSVRESFVSVIDALKNKVIT